MSVRTELEGRVGEVIGVGDWHTITQADIDRFADATRDLQWIHVDAARAAEGPFGATIAHGFMTLALIPGISPALELPGVKMIVNYGLNRVRFISPVRTGSRVRVIREIAGVSEKPNGIHLEERVTIELEGSAKPACVAETLILLVV